VLVFFNKFVKKIPTYDNVLILRYEKDKKLRETQLIHCKRDLLRQGCDIFNVELVELYLISVYSTMTSCASKFVSPSHWCIFTPKEVHYFRSVQNKSHAARIIF
jgi:hypothetical protein